MNGFESIYKPNLLSRWFCVMVLRMGMICLAIFLPTIILLTIIFQNNFVSIFTFIISFCVYFWLILFNINQEIIFDGQNLVFKRFLHPDILIPLTSTKSISFKPIISIWTDSNMYEMGGACPLFYKLIWFEKTLNPDRLKRKSILIGGVWDRKQFDILMDSFHGMYPNVIEKWM